MSDLDIDIITTILRILALDGDDRTWAKLAYLTCNNKNLLQRARRMDRPAVFHVSLQPDSSTGDTLRNSLTFLIPFFQAETVRIEVDWGDDSERTVVATTMRSVSHKYSRGGEYCVRVYPHRNASITGSDRGIFLDHLGFSDRIKISNWWKPLRGIASLGSLGLLRSTLCSP